MTLELSPEAHALNRMAARSAFPYPMFPFGGAGDRIIDQLVPGWRDQADIVTADFIPLVTGRAASLPSLQQGYSKPLLIISAGVPSSLAPGGHAVAVKIDHRNGSILYQDPYGSPAPKPVEGWLRQQFPGYGYQHSTARQQQDNISCSWMEMGNILAWLQERQTDPNVQQNLDPLKLKFLRAMRPIWPELVQHAFPPLRDGPVGRMRIISQSPPPSDPKELPCFQDLERLLMRLVIS